MGWLSAIGAGVGGMGQAAADYRKETLDRWQQSRDSLAKLIAQQHDDTFDDPERKKSLRDLHGKLLTLRPGMDPSKLYQTSMEHLTIHPAAEALMKKHEPQPPPKAPPGPAQPGSVPGVQVQPGTFPGSTGIDQVYGGMPGGLPSSGAAAQPATSPTQGGGSSPGAAFRPVPPVTSADNTQAPPAQGSEPNAIQPVQPQVAQSSGGGGGGGMDIPGFPHPRNTFDMLHEIKGHFGNTLSKTEREFLQPAMQSDISHNATLQQQESVMQANVAIKRYGLAQAEQMGIFKGMDPKMVAMIKAQALIPGLTMPPGMMNAMYGAPIRQHVDATNMSPEDKEANGLKPDAVGKFTILLDRITRLPIKVDQGWAGVQTTINAAGERGVQTTNDALQKGLQAPGGGPSLTPSQSNQRVITNPDGTTAFQSPAGAKTGQAATPTGGVNPAMQPTTTSNTQTQIKDINGQLVPVQVHSSTTRTRGGARGTAPTTAAPATPAPRPTGGPSVQVGESLGDPHGTWKMKQENQLTPDAQKLMTVSTPTLELIQRLKSSIQLYVKAHPEAKNQPAAMILPRIAYALGYNNEGALMSQLELSGISQAGAVLKNAGIRSNSQILNRALIHTPNAWKDSPSLMLDKIGQIEQNIKDIQRAAKTYQQKYPGLNAVPGGGNDDAVNQLRQKYDY